jgi:SAM-dependent methyltransferase
VEGKMDVIFDYFKKKAYFLKKKFYRIKVLGISNLFKCFYWRLKLKVLAYKSGLALDPWHITVNIYCRPYKWRVIEIANSLNPNSVVDIGCGLGEILSRVKAQYRVGIDIDKSCIYFANKLNKGPIYIEGSFDSVLALPVKDIDLLIMVGLIHGIPMDTLSFHINQILDSKRCKYIITDIYREDYPNRGVVHDLSKYNKRIKLINAYDDYEGYRYIMLWRVDNNGC